MRHIRLIAAILLPLALPATALAARRGVKPADLIKAGQAATVSAVDYRRASCNDDRTIVEWLKEAVGDTARSIKWSGAACRLANKNNPRVRGAPRRATRQGLRVSRVGAHQGRLGHHARDGGVRDQLGRDLHSGLQASRE